MSAERILAIYRACFAVLIIVASVQTLVAAHEGAAHHAVPLAAAEIAGALALLWRPMRLAGAGVLLCVFAAAQVLSAFGGAWPTRFLQYAASTLLIVALERALRMPAAGRSPAGAR